MATRSGSLWLDLRRPPHSRLRVRPLEPAAALHTALKRASPNWHVHRAGWLKVRLRHRISGIEVF
jgi:hypothetical protein